MAKRKRRTCPKLTWSTKTLPGEVKALAHDPDGRLVGRASMWLKEPGTKVFPRVASVGYIRVDNSLQRCGIGTKLYERLARVACERGVHLASDIQRTRFSEGFWQKQRKKGRAVCLHRRHTLEDKRYPETVDVSVPEGSPCDQYVMKSPCPVDLGKARKKRRRR